MKTTTSMLAAAAVAGLFAGASSVRAADTLTGSAFTTRGVNRVSTVSPLAGARAHNLDAAAGKHDCKGMNSCKGEGGCKASDNGCKGKNSCKGKGGCKTAEPTSKPATL